MLEWFYLGFSFVGIALTIYAGYYSIRRSGKRRRVVAAESRRYILYWTFVIVVAVSLPALVYDDYRLARWLIGLF
jgi:hypothetical protein